MVVMDFTDLVHMDQAALGPQQRQQQRQAHLDLEKEATVVVVAVEQVVQVVITGFMEVEHRQPPEQQQDLEQVAMDLMA